MDLHNLPAVIGKQPKRLGRGYGSGVGGHTVGRGQKGQKTRSKVAMWFEGGQLPLSRRLPFWRGKDRFKPTGEEQLPIQVGLLDVLPAKSKVDAKLLQEKGIISKRDLAKRTIKIVGGGNLTKALTVTLLTSKSAQSVIEKAGGTIDRGKTD